MVLQEHAFDALLKRQLFSIAVAEPASLPPITDLPSTNFACLIAWDARDSSADEISGFVELLLRAGASYFVCWGPDCERVHDIADEQLASCPGNDFGVPADSCIMTTWHQDEPLEEALWFFLVNTQPNEHHQSTTRASLAISVGSTAWAEEIAVALKDPVTFVRRGSGDGAA